MTHTFMRRCTLSIIMSIMSSYWLSALYATDLPPMPPFMQQNGKPSKQEVAKPTTNTKAKEKKWQRTDLNAIPACTSLPPMIIFLPPPMEKELISCRNIYFKPSLQEASAKLSQAFNKKLKVNKIEIVEGFREVYKVHIKEKNKKYTRYCNKDMNSCLK